MKRVLLKLSGEALLGSKEYGIDVNVIDDICTQIKTCHELGYKIAIVIGGGNIFRGVSGSLNGMDRANADYVGMLATIMNSIALYDGFKRLNIEAKIFSALEVKNVIEPFFNKKAMAHLDRGDIVIFSAGTGNPFFTTDTAAALRAVEMKVDILLKATKVKGVYSDDPVKNKDAIFYESLTFKEVIEKNLKVMDLTAFTLCQENNLPLRVFSMKEKDSIISAIIK